MATIVIWHGAPSIRFLHRKQLITLSPHRRRCGQPSHRNTANLLKIPKESSELVGWQFLSVPQSELEFVPQILSTFRVHFPYSRFEARR